jgi:small subunit ribosomal protein S17
MKKLIGTIIKASSDKTKMVEIVRIKRHPLYQKTYKASSKILAHDEKNEYKVTQKVEIVPCRPISRKKAWKIVKEVK